MPHQDGGPGLTQNMANLELTLTTSTMNKSIREKGGPITIITND